MKNIMVREGLVKEDPFQFPNQNPNWGFSFSTFAGP
jgi:hypothetical protein